MYKWNAQKSLYPFFTSRIVDGGWRRKFGNDVGKEEIAIDFWVWILHPGG